MVSAVGTTTPTLRVGTEGTHEVASEVRFRRTPRIGRHERRAVEVRTDVRPRVTLAAPVGPCSADERRASSLDHGHDPSCPGEGNALTALVACNAPARAHVKAVGHVAVARYMARRARTNVVVARGTGPIEVTVTVLEVVGLSGTPARDAAAIRCVEGHQGLTATRRSGSTDVCSAAAA